MAGRVEHVQRHAFDGELVALGEPHRHHVDLAVLAHDRHAMGTVAQRAQPGQVIGMQMRVYRLDQSEIELVDELDVAIDLLKHRVDDQRLAAAPAGDEIGVSPGHAVEELAEDHHCDSPIRGLRIPSAPCAQYKSSMVRQKEARSPLSAGRRLAALSRIAEDRRATAINATRATMIIISVKPMPVGLPGYPIIADKR